MKCGLFPLYVNSQFHNIIRIQLNLRLLSISKEKEKGNLVILTHYS